MAPGLAAGNGKVLLLDGYSTRTLACVRSWARRNVRFAVGGETRWDMSLRSRYATQRFVYTSPKRDVARFIADVNAFSRQFEADCVFPTSEAAIMALSAHRDALACVPIIPAQSDIDATFSKANTLELARSVGIAIPRTVLVSDRSALDALTLDPPIAVKSASSHVLASGQTRTSGKTAYVLTRSELERECTDRLAHGQAVLLQEFIDGYGVGVSGLFANGNPVALLGHRRVRESDPAGGPSALAETVEIEPELLDATKRLFARIGFSGPAMAEYKVERRTGRPYLMEVNGRFWGTILLGPAAGLDLPYLYWKLLSGEEIRPEETCYRVGVRGRYLVGDTKCLLLCLRGPPAGWPGSWPKRWRAIGDYLRSFVDIDTTELLLARDDPMPFFARLVQESRLAPRGAEPRGGASLGGKPTPSSR